MRRHVSLVLFLAAGRSYGADDVVLMEAVTVTADRLPDVAEPTPFSQLIVSEAELRTAPQLRLDDVLRNAAPGFSIFRRSSSRVTNPTAQGVSLRNLGPNGAGRTLVLLDGIPLNDPFAGWVSWSRVPPASLHEVIVNPGGGAGLFGNAALAGTMHLLSAEPVPNAAQAKVTVGDHDTSEVSVDAHLAAGAIGLSTFVNRFSSGGYPVLQDDQRGPVDTDADAASWTWQSRLHWRPGENTRLSLTAGVFDEDRTDGTKYTRNSSQGQDAVLTFEQRFPGLDAALRIQGYAQRRRFDGRFSAIDPTRSVETPALDQYDVPATAAGGSAVWEQQFGAHRVTGGADARWVEGETRERYLFANGGFTRDRNAGGRQWFVGAFLEERWQGSPAVEFVIGGRLDYWEQDDGHRRERDLLTGNTLLNATLDEQDGVIPNGRIGVSAALTRQVRARAAGYTGFRAPTLNELYRPFRVGNDITEANSALEPERLYGGELGVDWEPVQRFSFSVTGFHNQLLNAVGNVTIGRGPGTFEPGGFVPAGGILRQRRNLDRVEVFGVEASAVWKVASDWRLRAGYVYTHPTVDRADEEPDLEGKWLAQSPQHVAVASLEWAPGRWRLAAQGRYFGTQFEDDLNTLPLAPFFTVDASVAWAWSAHTSATLRVENLFDTETEIGKTGSGLVRIGAPRLVSFTLALGF